MPWNKPGGGKDPWSNGPKKGGNELDEMLGKITKRLGGSNGSKRSTPSAPSGMFKFLPLLLILAWLASGIFIVSEGKRGLILHFGQFKSERPAGLGWHIPYPVETVEIVDVDNIRSYTYDTTMLTKDENIVEIALAAQYRIKDPVDYLFNVRDPDFSLQQAVESALREAVGGSTMDYVLKEGRADVAAQTKKTTQIMLDDYGTGIIVTSVNLQDSQPPEQVQPAFIDAIKAREDEQKYISEAQAYSNRVIPEARGTSARLRAEAEAYKEQVISEAQGDASRFEQLMTEYQKAPEVTRERLYLETIESVYARTNKVLMEGQSGGNSLMYLPLDKLMGGSSSSFSNSPNRTTISSPARSDESSVPTRETNRSREQR